MLRNAPRLFPLRATGRSYSTQADPEWAQAKPYSQIPGPKPLPIPKFGNFWRMLPGGTYGGLSFTEFERRLYETYGPIVRVTGLGRHDLVFLFDPSDVQKVYRTEGPWPYRTTVPSFDYYRTVTRADLFKGNIGITSSQGEEWQKNRTAVNQTMMKPSNMISYHHPLQHVAAEFIQRMRSIRDKDNELPADFMNELNKWALESISLAALDTRLGCLDPDLRPDSDAQVMIDAVSKAFKLFYRLDFLPSLYKYVSTRNWRAFVTTMDTITEITLKHVNAKIKDIEARPVKEQEQDQSQSVLETLLRSPGGRDTAVSTAMDMMTAGIDTTSNATAIALYYLATHPKVQEKLRCELLNVLPHMEDHLPANYLNSVPFLKACIKESQRLTPIAAANTRATGQDIVIKEFQVPKGVNVMMCNMVMSHMEEHFAHPMQFIPERWLKSEESSALSGKNTNPFVVLPFGFGPRMCIGRRFAELEMHTLVAMVVRNFNISYEHGPMEWKSELLVTPKSPLRFRIQDRTE